jgi:DNA repair protein RecO (recombination protein O)
MALLVTPAIVLHAFDYLESSRIVRLLTRDAGLRSAMAKGARRSQRRFGGGLDLFSQGSTVLHVKAGRDLDTLSGFEDARGRPALAADLERFTGAETIAEIALRFGREGADLDLFDVTTAALDAIAESAEQGAREATLAGAWQLMAALGFAPALADCAECGSALDQGDPALFSHSAGGALCSRCAPLTTGGRRLPATARSAIGAWTGGQRLTELSDADSRAHQRLLREFLGFHVHDGRPLRAFDLWEGLGRPGTATQELQRPSTTSEDSRQDFRHPGPTSDVSSAETPQRSGLPVQPVPE